MEDWLKEAIEQNLEQLEELKERMEKELTQSKS